MQEVIPDNPYDHSTGPVTTPNGVEDVNKTQATNSPRDIVNGGTNGWAYFAATVTGDSAIFWANTDYDGSVDEFDF